MVYYPESGSANQVCMENHTLCTDYDEKESCVYRKYEVAINP